MRNLLRRWPQRTLAVAVLVVLAGSVALVLIGVDPNVIAAIASAVAALAALGSATSSNQTARDALRALSYATKPTISIRLFNDDEQGGQALIVNESEHAIARLTVRGQHRDDSHTTEQYGFVPGIHRFGAPAEGRITVPLPNRGRNSGDETLTVDYWGIHGPTGWRQQVTWHHNYTEGQLPDGTRTAGYSRAENREPETELS